MYEKKIDEELDCGIRVAFKVFGGKWKLCIIDAINCGITRPAEIIKSISGATSRVIEMQLAELLAFGVVERAAEEVYPKKSEYKLTSLGKTIIPILDHVDKWGSAHSVFIKERQFERSLSAENVKKVCLENC